MSQSPHGRPRVSADDLAAAFAEDYFAARAKFLAAAQAAGARLTSVRCPAPGPAGEALSMDAAWLGAPDAKRLMVVTSAIHGIEGSAGSAIQIDWLRRASAPSGVAVLLIHTVNPYGMAWTCLETEDGVDLNRNFIDYDGVVPQNPLYDELDDVFMCPELDGPVRAAADAHRDAYIAEHGLDRYLRAGADGQRHRPGRFNFGGDRPTWSNRTVRALVEDLARGASAIGWVDVHTGIGVRGNGIMLVIEPSPAAEARAAAWWGDYILIPSPAFPFVPKGTLVSAAAAMAPWAEVTAAALEFGTEPVDRVADSMIERFWLTTFSNIHAPEAAATMAEIEDCLAPLDTAWRRAILERGREVLDQTLSNLALG